MRQCQMWAARVRLAAKSGEYQARYNTKRALKIAEKEAENAKRDKQVRWHTAIFMEMERNLKVVITDVAGNVGVVDSNTISYQLDTANDAPTATLVSPVAVVLGCPGRGGPMTG